MKKIIISVILALSAGLMADAGVLTKKQAAFFNGRRIAVSRDTKTIPGSVITTWYRNGKPDTKLPAIETNVLKRIIGKEQNNPLQHIIVGLTNSLFVASNRYEVAEAKIANSREVLTARRAEYVTKRDEAKLVTTKAIYQAFIDIIDDLLNKLEAIANKED